MAIDLSAYHRERRAAVEHLNQSMLGLDGPAKKRRHRFRRIVCTVLVGLVATAAGALASYHWDWIVRATLRHLL